MYEPNDTHGFADGVGNNIVKLVGAGPSPARLAELQATGRLKRIAEELQGERKTIESILRAGSAHKSFRCVVAGLSDVAYEFYHALHSMRKAF